MDPISNFATWLGDVIAAEVTYLMTIVPLKVEAAWLEAQLVWTDIKLAVIA
jgi:hypothetical protein